jgi:hypothetical protein
MRGQTVIVVELAGAVSGRPAELPARVNSLAVFLPASHRAHTGLSSVTANRTMTTVHWCPTHCWVARMRL